jgi:hypothetical protein
MFEEYKEMKLSEVVKFYKGRCDDVGLYFKYKKEIYYIYGGTRIDDKGFRYAIISMDPETKVNPMGIEKELTIKILNIAINEMIIESIIT